MKCFYHAVWTGFLLASMSLSSAQQILAGQSWEIPFRLYNGYAVVLHGSIGELDDCNLVIDTGTSPTIVDERIVRKLHLSSSKAKMSVADGDIASLQAVVPAIEVGPIVKRNLATAVRNLSELSKNIGLRVDAIVGLDVLGENNLRINYDHRIIAFNDAIANPSNKADFESGPPLVVLAIKMNQQTFHVLVDTGSFGLLLFESRIGSELGGTLLPPGTSQSLAGELDLREVKVQDASIGNLHLKTHHAFLAKGPKRVHFDGILGIASLGVSEVSFDFQRRQFAWQ